MEKKEYRKGTFFSRGFTSPKKENNLLPKTNAFSNRLFGIVKFVLGLCLLPFVYSVTAAFLTAFNSIAKDLQGYFWGGVISFIIIYLFIYEPILIYKRGQRLLEIVFSFFKPLVKVAPYLLPIHTIVIFIVYSLFYFVFKPRGSISFFLFLLGFSMALHLVFSAKSLRTKQEDLLKANYIFGFSFVYIINISLLSFFLNLIFKEFSFVNFFNHSSQIAISIFAAVFKQLFI